jgi:hypothetical protein
MFKVYKRTIHIGSTAQPQQIEYQVEANGRSKISKFLAIPAMIAGAVVGTLVFSVFFAALLILLGACPRTLLSNKPTEGYRKYF